MRSSAQEEGRRAEARFADRLGLGLVAGSGATHRFKLDAGNVELLVEHKWTSSESYRLTAVDVRKALAGSKGPRSRSQVMAFVVEMEGLAEPVWCLTESDALALARGEIDLDLSFAPNEIKRSAAEPTYE